MKAYKGFNKDMTCRGFQFEEGKTYETDEAKLCESGFHACEMPFDCFSYYAPSKSVYHEVELEATDEKSDDSKRVGKKIKIGARLSIAKIVEAQIEYVKSQTHDEEGGQATGERGAASATGWYGAASATGWCGAASATGEESIAIASGYSGKARACKGSAICLCERGEWNGRTFPLLGVKAAIVDGVTLKPDTWYTLKDGEFVEVDG